MDIFQGRKSGHAIKYIAKIFSTSLFRRPDWQAFFDGPSFYFMLVIICFVYDGRMDGEGTPVCNCTNW
jgi:hypothetical protein